MLDIFVADEIKPVLFPILEDTSTVEKIRQLQVEFPIVIMEPMELLLGKLKKTGSNIEFLLGMAV